MKCPRCGEEILSTICRNCNETVPENSRFCCWCGSQVKKEEEPPDPSDRVPCKDGTCIGTVNERGVCSVCGKPLA